MDTASQAAVDGGEGRSGGKILKKRKLSATKTPYDRPAPPPQPENPNWRNGLLFPAKFVAGGASKLLSSIWNPKSWAAWHSSSSDSDSDSEVGVEDDYVRGGNLPDGDAELNKNKGSSSGKSEILYLIEQLIMLEHFSREECDRLIEIINSRVVDYTTKSKVDDAPKDPDISNKAIMEAGKMISENMAGPSSKTGNETANLASNDTKSTQDDVPTETLLSLPTIEEQNLITEERDDKTNDDVNLVEENHDLITERAEVADVINISQGSSNTSDPTSTKAANGPSANRPVTRARKYNTRRGRGRGK